MKTTFIIVAFLFSIVLSAQSIESFSIDNGGALSTNNTLKILYTIGEVHIQEFNTGSISVSEGFINSTFIPSTLGIEVDLLANEIVIYPNPTSAVINVKTTLRVNNIEFFDFLGRKIFETKEMLQIKVSHLSSGTYFIKIFLENGVVNKKIFVQ